MSPSNPPSTLRIGRRPIHAMLVPFPIVCFTGTLACDIAYWKSMNIMWVNFSAWLVTAGVVFGLLAGLTGFVDFAASREVRRQAPAWPHAIGNILALVLSVFNMFVHMRDGWTAVVPWGLALSAAVFMLLLFTGWMGSSLVYRHRVGVADQ